ncbi:MAG: Bor/Iss family lipoprotein [Gemmatimonadaceae bacterium]
MTRRRWVPAALALVLSTACFHEVVQTGRPAGSTVIDKPWVTGWLWGLVAAEPIDARPLCPSGVAVVTTETSFLNGLASAVTFGIFTPQHVMITCASGGRASLPRGAAEIRIPATATGTEARELINQAVEQANDTHAPVILRF